MNRRHFLSAAAFLAAPSVARAFQFGVSHPPKPYGADRMENTDLKALQESIRNELITYHYAVPKIFDLAPDSDSIDAGYVADQDAVRDEDPKLHTLRDISDLFNDSSSGQPVCHPRLADRPVSWRTFVELHEATHVITSRPAKNGLSLMDRTFQSINGLLPREVMPLISEILNSKMPDVALSGEASATNALSAIISDRNMDVVAVNFCSYYQIDESLSDANAVLYVLSNYDDRSDTRSFFDHLIDMREASYNDCTHMTVPALRAAFEVFDKHPVKNLPLVKTAKLASDIVAGLPFFGGSFEERAEAIREDIKNRIDFVAQANVSSAWHDNVIAARDRFCVVTPKP